MIKLCTTLNNLQRSYNSSAFSNTEGHPTSPNGCTCSRLSRQSFHSQYWSGR